MLYLKSLPLHLVEGLVIRHLSDKTGHFGTKVFIEFRKRGFGVLDGIVQSGSEKSRLVEYSAFCCEDSCNCDGMIDVWGCFSILPTIVAMLFRRK